MLGTDGQVLITAPFGGDVPQEVTVERGETSTRYVGPPVDEVREEFDYFAHCVRAETVCETAGKEGLTDLEIVSAAYDSAVTGERVKL